MLLRSVKECKNESKCKLPEDTRCKTPDKGLTSKQPQASNLDGTKILLVTTRLTFARYFLNLRCRLSHIVPLDTLESTKTVTYVSTLCVAYVLVHHGFLFPQRF